MGMTNEEELDLKWEAQRCSGYGECKIYTEAEIDIAEVTNIYRRHGFMTQQNAARLCARWDLEEPLCEDCDAYYGCECNE